MSPLIMKYFLQTSHLNSTKPVYQCVFIESKDEKNIYHIHNSYHCVRVYMLRRDLIGYIF